MYCKIDKNTNLLKIPNNKYADDNEVYSFKGRTIDLTKKIRVFRNLNKSGVWYSIRQNGLTVAHAKSLCVSNCKFIVNQKTRERIVATGKKEVHAFIEGDYTTSGMGTTAKRNDLKAKIVYNPIIYTGFTCINLTNKFFKVDCARFVICDNNGVSAAYLN